VAGCARQLRIHGVLQGAWRGPRHDRAGRRLRALSEPQATAAPAIEIALHRLRSEQPVSRPPPPAPARTFRPTCLRSWRGPRHAPCSTPWHPLAAWRNSATSAFLSRTGQVAAATLGVDRQGPLQRSKDVGRSPRSCRCACREHAVRPRDGCIKCGCAYACRVHSRAARRGPNPVSHMAQRNTRTQRIVGSLNFSSSSCSFHSLPMRNDVEASFFISSISFCPGDTTTAMSVESISASTPHLVVHAKGRRLGRWKPPFALPWKPRPCEMPHDSFATVSSDRRE